MRRKLQSSHGFTLVEVLAATIVMVLLTLVVSVGSQVAVRTYTQVVTQAEASVLCGTLSEAASAELRYATQVTCNADGTVLGYISRQYGDAAQLLAQNGRLTVDARGDTYQLLGEKTYSSGLTCDLSLTWAADVFTVHLTILDDQREVREETTFAVSQLNP